MSESDIDIDRIIEKWEKEIQETNDASNEIKTKLKNNKSRIDNND